MMKHFFRLVAVLLMLAVVACSFALAQEAAEPRLSLTTGLPTEKEYTPYMINLDNAGGARPQKGLAAADIIYEAEIENGGATRYTLLFNDYIPEIAEPVRSARMLHADIALDWNATFIHYGGQQLDGTNVYDYMSEKGVVHIDGISVGQPYFHRDSNRAAPHNVICELSDIVQSEKYGRVAEEKSPLKFDAESYTKIGEPVKTFEIVYKKGYAPAYSYNEEDGLYYRYYNREQQLDGETGEAVTCANVIIMYADYTYYNWEGDRPVAELTGKNYCKYFIDGNYFEGYWTRRSVDNATYFRDVNGDEVIFKPGKTCIQIIREDKEITMN